MLWCADFTQEYAALEPHGIFKLTSKLTASTQQVVGEGNHSRTPASANKPNVSYEISCSVLSASLACRFCCGSIRKCSQEAAKLAQSFRRTAVPSCNLDAETQGYRRLVCVSQRVPANDQSVIVEPRTAFAVPWTDTSASGSVLAITPAVSVCNAACDATRSASQPRMPSMLPSLFCGELSHATTCHTAHAHKRGANALGCSTRNDGQTTGALSRQARNILTLLFDRVK